MQNVKLRDTFESCSLQTAGNVNKGNTWVHRLLLCRRYVKNKVWLGLFQSFRYKKALTLHISFSFTLLLK